MHPRGIGRPFTNPSRVPLAFVVMLFAAAVGGCGSEEEAVRDAVYDYVEAYVDEDAEALCDSFSTEVLTSDTSEVSREEAVEDCAAQVEEEGLDAVEGNVDNSEDTEVVDISIQGETATATVISPEGEEEVEDFVKEDGEWKLNS
jgi:hypothetical protein